MFLLLIVKEYQQRRLRKNLPLNRPWNGHGNLVQKILQLSKEHAILPCKYWDILNSKKNLELQANTFCSKSGKTFGLPCLLSTTNSIHKLWIPMYIIKCTFMICYHKT